MEDAPDMSFDIDALFAHMREDLGYQGTELDWHFILRSDDIENLAAVGESLASEFVPLLQDGVETVEDGREFVGPPMLALMTRGAFSADEVKAIAARIQGLAEDHGLTYEGVTCGEPFDEDDFDWMDLDGAIWRLRHFTDSGLEEGAEMPWVFAIAGDDDMLERTADALVGAGLGEVEIIEGWDDENEDAEESEDDGPLLMLRCEGINDEGALESMYREVERVAGEAQAELLGVQFFEDDDEEGDDDEQ